MDFCACNIFLDLVKSEKADKGTSCLDIKILACADLVMVAVAVLLLYTLPLILTMNDSTVDGLIRIPFSVPKT